MSKTGFNQPHFKAVLADFAEENPLACQGILSVARLVFTEEVPTLAVTLRDDPPLLLVNPKFVARHVQTEDDIRALLLHEFLHVLLGHTKLFERMDQPTNLALDAVINHIVQRELGVEGGEFFRRFYRPKGDHDPVWLLRPHAPGDIRPQSERAAAMAGRICWRPDGSRKGRSQGKALMIHQIRRGLARAEVLADDVLDLIDSLDLGFDTGIEFIGGHGSWGGTHPREGRESSSDMHPVNLERLEHVFKQLDGNGIFRRPQDHGVGAVPARGEWACGDPHRSWRAATIGILRRLLLPDPRSRPVPEGLLSYCLPVATSQDRRAALRSLWNPILPEFDWSTDRLQPGGRANVYLDVSGSMDHELGLLTSLLWNLRHWIRSPFHAFSNGVHPARIVDGILQTETTGGTCFNDVLEHILAHRPGKSLIITDGYIEKPDARLLRELRARGEQIHALISANGSREPFEAHFIPCRMLPAIMATQTTITR